MMQRHTPHVPLAPQETAGEPIEATQPSATSSSDLLAFRQMVAEYGVGPAESANGWDGSDGSSHDVVLRELSCGLAHELPRDSVCGDPGRRSFSSFMLSNLERLCRRKRKK